MDGAVGHIDPWVRWSHHMYNYANVHCTVIRFWGLKGEVESVEGQLDKRQKNEFNTAANLN